MKRATTAALLVGLALVTALITWQGASEVAAATAQAGWAVLTLPLFYLLPLAFAALSWRYLLVRELRVGAALAYLATWLGLAMNWLLPVAQIGGDFAKAHWVYQRIGRAPELLAAAVADKTLQVGTQAAFAVIGLIAFVSLHTPTGALGGLAAGVALLGAGTWAFYRLQRRGLFAMLAGMAERLLRAARKARLSTGADQVDAEVRAIYGRRLRLWTAAAYRMGFRLVLIGETALALHLLGQSFTWADALILESLGMAVRAGSFLIPAGLGAQEGAFTLLAVALGLPGESGFAISLCKRVREVVLGVPVLAGWQAHQARRGLAF